MLYLIIGYEIVELFNCGDIDGGYGVVFFGVGNYGLGLILFFLELVDGLLYYCQWMQEFCVEFNEWGCFDWQVGVFYFDEDVIINNFNYDLLVLGNLQIGYVVQNQCNKVWVVFVLGDFDVIDCFKLCVGVCYIQDKKDFSVSVLQVVLFGILVSGLYLVNIDVNDVSWDLSGVYKLIDDINVYVCVVKGFCVLLIQGCLVFVLGLLQVDLEKVILYEVGIKVDLFECCVCLGLSVFCYDVDGQQLIVVGGFNNIVILFNVDKIIGQGVELDLEVYLVDNVLLIFGSSYNDIEIKDKSLVVVICGGGCIIIDLIMVINGQIYVLVNGNLLLQVLKWIYNVILCVGFLFSDGSELYVYIDWVYCSVVNFFIYELLEFRGCSLLEGGLCLGYNWGYGQYDVVVFGCNLINQICVVGVIDFNNLIGFFNESWIWGVEFIVKF